MRRGAIALGVAAGLAAGPALPLGTTGQACMASPRTPGEEICQCVQGVADDMLSEADQKTAADLIAEPDLFLEFKYERKEAAFLERYLAWGEAAAEACGKKRRR